MVSPDAQSPTLSFSIRAATACPVVNRGVVSSVSRRKVPHPTSRLLSRGSSQLQYSLLPNAVLRPMIATASTRYYHLMLGQVLYTTPIVCQLNPAVVPTSSSWVFSPFILYVATSLCLSQSVLLVCLSLLARFFCLSSILEWFLVCSLYSKAVFSIPGSTDFNVLFFFCAHVLLIVLCI